MESFIMKCGILLMVLCLCSKKVEGKKDEVLYCSACRAIVEELNYSIKQVDPKKTIQVGNFRIAPDGSQKHSKVPFARSETHLTELMEEVCNHMNDYSLYVDPETKEKLYKRFAPRDGDPDKSMLGNLQHFQFGDGPDSSKSLKFACESIVEEYEDDIISLYAQEADHVVDKLCRDISDLCKDSLAFHTEL
ncbi:protein canopy-1-like [Acipenser ruthenus]|uniref:protein canopy-1-like n=1 Tax=Acipenser ruthenus TaxID=7906 RepID=UPI00145AEF68|nr:protein canopy-1-like [Acipenser ruthenus]XP_033854921.1 protein canopy-1-like [Acipenser ruthenus]